MHGALLCTCSIAISSRQIAAGRLSLIFAVPINTYLDHVQRKLWTMDTKMVVIFAVRLFRDSVKPSFSFQACIPLLGGDNSMQVAVLCDQIILI
jgi:hypothetical protein